MAAQLNDRPRPDSFLCPTNGRPDRRTISEALGFNVPLPFAQLVEWIYDESSGDPYRCDDYFTKFVGLYAADGRAHYAFTPCEMFPFAATGVDGAHYGYLVHAPELDVADYPVCGYCPIDSDGVSIEGSNTYDGLALIISVWGDPQLCPASPDWHTALNKVGIIEERDDIDLVSIIAIPQGWKFLQSSDGVGVLAPSKLFGSPPVSIDPSGPIETFVTAADGAIKAGHLATALYYLREAYWFTWFNQPKPIYLCERLCEVYHKLGRPSLASVMNAQINAWQQNT